MSADHNLKDKLRSQRARAARKAANNRRAKGNVVTGFAGRIGKPKQ